MRKLITRYDGTKGTAHRRIAQGTIEARSGFLFVVFTTGLHKGYAIEVPITELKYRGTSVGRLSEDRFLSPDR